MATAFLPSFCNNSGNISPQRLLDPQPHLLSASNDLKTKPPSKLNKASVARTLLSYIDSSRMEEALSLFETTKKPDTFLWNLMIRGYANSEFYQEAMDFYHRMQAAGMRADNFTFPFVIKSCIALSSFDEGLKVHGRLFKVGLDSDLFICNSLIGMYSKFGLVEDAERVFDEMPIRDIVSWNSMIDGYVLNGEGWRSLICFREMQEASGLQHDRYGVMSALAACSLEMSANQGKEIHCHVIRHGLESDIKVQTSLLDMYCKCGKVFYAERLFQTMNQRNVVTWNALIGGYALNNQPHKAFACIVEMQADSIGPDAVTMVNLLPACGQVRGISHGKAIHGLSIRKSFLPHLVLETALIDMYAKCGELGSAEWLFDQMTEKSLVSWNAMIAAYVQNGRNMKALEVFLNLCNRNLEPDLFTISSIMPAYAELASLRYGKQIHSYVLKSKYGSNTLVLNCIIYMYARCGDLKTSREVFDRMVCKDIVSWNTIIIGYGYHGHGKIALDLFSDMKSKGIQPNESTFVSVLTACSLSGLVDEGWLNFNAMQQEYNISPQIEHYGCMVDLLGRTGDLKEAVDFIERMPLVPTARIWGSLLTASRNKNDIEMAEFAAEKIFALEHDNTGCYVLLSSMYADAGRWSDVERVKSLMKEEGVQKTTARSLLELDGKTCTFINGDMSHDQSNITHEVSDILSKGIGETANDSDFVFNPVEVGAKKASLPKRHSVRLAVVFGLISTTVGSPILVKKNVRICNDCHHAIKLISRYSKREIIIGDTRIYHHFTDGFCCCGDYW
uniref:Pentatricopeptide repeat-containing protein At4g35130, chloroplastic n=1 Tax=Elaeis guineensis var. tenera TaxID=51953 RepID=A0A6I9SPS0_ELAGV|nr:pentatricopeptide repeat-containing protein At4g35130, chloroplastic [Elaeis guineensis]